MTKKEKENFIRYLEDKIKETQFMMNNVKRGFHNYVITRTKRDTYMDILERIKNGIYD